MYKCIIAAIGLSHGHGPRTMEMARALKAEGGRIVAVHVLEPVPGFASNYLPADHEKTVHENTKAAMEERIGEKRDAEIVILHGYAGITLTEYAEEVGADCIIVGSHKPDIKDYLLGSTAARVVRHASRSVHVLR